jgi:hypothetical protein
MIKDIDIPVPAFDQGLWGRMSFESKKNIKMVEKIHRNSSLYTLMHYFVTLEQEFRGHFIQPFHDLCINALSKMQCLQIVIRLRTIY